MGTHLGGGARADEGGEGDEESKSESGELGGELHADEWKLREVCSCLLSYVSLLTVLYVLYCL